MGACHRPTCKRCAVALMPLFMILWPVVVAAFLSTMNKRNA